MSRYSDAGKGDGSRPMEVSREEFAKNHEAIFGKSKLQKKLEEEAVKKKCPNKNEKGFCPLHNLQCGYPNCEK